MPTIVTIPACVGCCGPCETTTLKCRIRGGTATLCGYAEYVSPSTPPKAYRKRTLSGSITGNTYSNASCSTFVCSSTDTDSGSCDYDATTCALTVGGVSVRTQVGSCGGTGSTPGCSFGSFPAGGDTDVYTQTQRTVTNDFVCRTFNGGVSYFNRSSQPTRKEVLSIEDTESDAITRLLAGGGGTWGSWIASGAAGCTGTPPSCCLARWESRSSGFSLVYQESQWELPFTGLTPGTSYTGKVNIWRRTFGSGSYTLFATVSAWGTADGSGNLTLTGDVPNLKGYESYAVAGGCP